ncbi:MAG: CapA family protein, partial [Clostridia bacterium]|nr:CapA family protein [Clostridia bacterium]
WGEEYKTEPESSTRRYAEQLVAAGADIIIGGHPHLVQPAEYITATDSSGNARTALCLYSLGNFLSQHYKVKDSDGGIVLEFSLIENEDGTISVANIGYVPVFVWRWPAVDANGNTRKLKGETIWELRVMPILPYVDNRPSGMSDESYNRMTEYLNSVTNLMGGDSVITRLAQ